ncbi:conserved exported hypothetical protein [Verrucomicrobia bacterium]|nr:conserved exported hypothetical protein [Verrucomicrobiota bacterium]
MKVFARVFKRLLMPATGLAAAALLCAPAGKSRTLVVHEWGTFTSVQGADGVLLDWRPLQTSVLPKFVYDWTKPGLNRQASAYLLFGKGGVVARQRMETPVLYFYSEEKQTVDVSVKFPQGLITEWYPQAREIGPSTVRPPSFLASLDSLAHKCGAKPNFSFASVLPNQNVPDSRVHWKDVTVLPERQNPGLQGTLARDASGSHYFSARATDSDYVELPSLGTSNQPAEHEKFLFYRGVGNFTTPLKVTMNADGRLTLANTGTEPLASLIELTLDHGAGNFICVDQLRPGENQALPTTGSQPMAAEGLSRQIGDAMAQALVKAGLYPREARAMVETWKDSWFAEDGLRVLYVLPRAWTDRTLPLALEPAPRELVRVMVGRSEILPPALEEHLAGAVAKAAQGDAAAKEEVAAEVKRLGRFGPAAIDLAARISDQRVAQTGLARETR